MKQIQLTLNNASGLHARPAKVLVNLAKQYKSVISVYHAEKKANAKSMISILTLGAVHGSQILLQTDGEDEDLALTEIEAAFRSGLGDLETQPAVQTIKAAPSSPTPAMQESKSERKSGIEISGQTIQGVPAAPGIGFGPLFHFRLVEPDLKDGSFSGDGKIDLLEAIRCAREQLQELSQKMKARKMAAEAGIFDAHIELLEDLELHEAVQNRITGGQGSVVAWKEAVEERAAMIAALPDPLLSARSNDLRDVGRRVLSVMLGTNEKAALPPTPVVVIARDLSPSDTAAFDPNLVLGFCLVEGGPTSHVAILARAMGLPAIVGVSESILDLQENTPIIINGNDGTIQVDPGKKQIAQAQQTHSRWLEQRRSAQDQADLPATTLDGRHVDVTANAGSVANAVEAVKKGADGIGLLRTEFLFLERSTAPSEEEQFEVYRAVAETMDPRPVIIRTLDIGGDKPLAYIHMKPEMNPFLGERGIRLCLNRPELFREQLRAILRAASFGTLRIMFPMVSDLAELRQARDMVEDLRRELDAPPVEIGIMIEVPSAALLADKFAPEIDFFSIGTNDLTQYTLAIDRAHPALAARHDGLHPAVLRLIARTIDAAHQYGKRADLCGELGSDPIAVPVLVGLGMDELSVSIPAVPVVKATIRTLNMAELIPLARQVLDCSTAQEVRDLVKHHLGH